MIMVVAHVDDHVANKPERLLVIVALRYAGPSWEIDNDPLMVTLRVLPVRVMVTDPVLVVDPVKSAKTAPVALLNTEL